jgi:hypothetical protein
MASTSGCEQSGRSGGRSLPDRPCITR